MMVELSFVRSLAKRAGEIIKDGYMKPQHCDAKDSYADLVTDVDKRVEDFLRSEILSVYPSHKFIAEEGYSRPAKLGSEPTWIIDPIDGTSNFVSRFPFVCVSIAYFVNQEPTIAVVYNPVLNCLYHAVKDEGAFRNDDKIAVSSVRDISEALVLTDWGGDRNPESLDKKCSNMRRIIAKARGVRTMGSAALHICQVAGGSGDAFFEFGIHCWDYAAAMLIVKEAGGYCCNYDGSSVDLMGRNFVCTSTPELAKALLPLIEPIVYSRD
ncbi:Inositol monophosphatase [Fasciola hepatica]|uniref:Inositol-1-monophosphatase n=1 Tax=Fasciola hepatica TaxID=6192 RepID=A0A4E0RTJ8_FASHE|nr:Inositol monophosphatase [Fasciola hepatica]